MGTGVGTRPVGTLVGALILDSSRTTNKAAKLHDQVLQCTAALSKQPQVQVKCALCTERDGTGLYTKGRFKVDWASYTGRGGRGHTTTGAHNRANTAAAAATTQVWMYTAHAIIKVRFTRLSLGGPKAGCAAAPWPSGWSRNELRQQPGGEGLMDHVAKQASHHRRSPRAMTERARTKALRPQRPKQRRGHETTRGGHKQGGCC